MAKSKFMSQFKKGQVPNQAPSWESTLNIREPDDASNKIKKRQGVALGAQTQANPGLEGGFAGSSAKRRKR